MSTNLKTILTNITPPAKEISVLEWLKDICFTAVDADDFHGGVLLRGNVRVQRIDGAWIVSKCTDESGRTAQYDMRFGRGTPAKIIIAAISTAALTPVEDGI